MMHTLDRAVVHREEGIISGGHPVRAPLLMPVNGSSFGYNQTCHLRLPPPCIAYTGYWVEALHQACTRLHTPAVLHPYVRQGSLCANRKFTEVPAAVRTGNSCSTVPQCYAISHNPEQLWHGGCACAARLAVPTRALQERLVSGLTNNCACTSMTSYLFCFTLYTLVLGQCPLRPINQRNTT